MSSLSQSIELISAANARLATTLGLELNHTYSATRHLYDYLSLLSLDLKETLITYWYRITDRGGRINDALVSIEEMMQFFSTGQPTPNDLQKHLPVIDKERATLNQAITKGCANSNAAAFPLRRLARAFDLDERALKLLVAAAAPGLDLGFERLYRFAQADFARRGVSADFLVELCARDAADMQAYRACLSPSHPLILFRLITLEHQDSGLEPSRATAYVQVPNRVLSILRDEGDLDDEHLEFATLHHTAPTLDELVLEEKIKDQLHMALITAQDNRARLVMTGPQGVGKVSLAKAMALQQGNLLLEVDLLQLDQDPKVARLQLAGALREATYQGAHLVLDDDGLFSTEEQVGNLLEPILWVMDTAKVPTYFITDKSPMWLHGRRDDLVELNLSLAPPPGQKVLWERIFLGLPMADHIDLGEIVQRYSLSAGSIHRAASEARRLAELRSGRGGEIRINDLITAIRHQFHHRLGSLAQPISTTLHWEDVVLPDPLLVRLREIVAFARHREAVYDKWGFRRKMSYGRGLTCMFSGPPGTGKTMMVAIIARELGRELFRVDIARVVDKYIGETEKNLAKVFEEAERSQAIILFDEADSLFAKRTEVKSSHDRYANLEVNYLLQRMEEFDGATFLTTNFETSIDEAFERRLRFKLTFPMPDEKERLRLWRSMFPPEAEVSNDIDWKMMAEEFEMSGGLIKNAVLRAAFLATEDERPIGHEHLYRAAVTELADAGHVIRDDVHRLW